MKNKENPASAALSYKKPLLFERLITLPFHGHAYFHRPLAAHLSSFTSRIDMLASVRHRCTSQTRPAAGKHQQPSVQSAKGPIAR